MANSGLVDELGHPISREEIAAMKAVTAPVDAEQARPPFTGHLAWGIEPQRLAAIVKAADGGNSLDWFILCEEVEELFPHYSSVLAKRRRQVAQLPITVADAEGETEAEKAAFLDHGNMVRAWLDAGLLERHLFDVLDAIGKGFSAHELVWDQTPDHVWPTHLKYRPQRFFEFSYKDMETLWLRTQQGFQNLIPHKWLIHRHPSKSGNLVRSGLTRMVVFLWCYSIWTARDWALFAQTYGLPMRVGKYGPGASDSDKRTLLRAVASIAGDVAAMIPESMQIEFVEANDKAGGASIYEKRLDWFNREVSKLVLGSTAGTEALNGGHAVGKEHRQTEEDVERFDAGLIAGSINHQIIPAMVAFRFGPQRAYPTIHIGRPDEVPLKDVVNGIAQLAPLGLKVKASQIRERLQLDPPEEGDEVIGFQQGAHAPPPPDDDDDDDNDDGDDALTARRFLARLVTLTSSLPATETDVLVARVARDAAGALHGMTAPILSAFSAAESMHDLAHRLHRLRLPDKEFAEAMSRGMALAHLVGQATVIEETRR